MWQPEYALDGLWSRWRLMLFIMRQCSSSKYLLTNLPSTFQMIRSPLSLIDSGITFSNFRLEPHCKKTRISKFFAVFLLYIITALISQTRNIASLEQIAHEMVWCMSKSSSDFAKEASKVLCCSQTGKVHVMFDALLLPQRLASESLGKQQTPEGLREWTVELFTYSQQQSS